MSKGDNCSPTTGVEDQMCGGFSLSHQPGGWAGCEVTMILARVGPAINTDSSIAPHPLAYRPKEG